MLAGATRLWTSLTVPVPILPMARNKNQAADYCRDRMQLFRNKRAHNHKDKCTQYQKNEHALVSMPTKSLGIGKRGNAKNYPRHNPLELMVRDET